MKKVSYFVGTMALAISAGVLFAGCGDDDDPEPVPVTGGTGGGTGGTDDAGTGGTDAGEGGTGGTDAGDGGTGGDDAGDGGTDAGEGGTDAGEGGADGGEGGTDGGLSCASAEDCGAPTQAMVCDPVQLTCAEAQCDGETLDCPNATDWCVPQWDGAEVGACYPGCVPFDGTEACPTDMQCVPADLALSEGVCIQQGTAATAEACDGEDLLSTGCGAGHICTDISLTADPNVQCVELCDFWADTADCGLDSQYCSYGGWCWTGTPAAYALGAACDAADDGADCGFEDGIARGICLEDTCQEWCRIGGTDCAGGATCTEVDPNINIGVCVAP